jgi:hypothetical protein
VSRGDCVCGGGARELEPSIAVVAVGRETFAVDLPGPLVPHGDFRIAHLVDERPLARLQPGLHCSRRNVDRLLKAALAAARAEITDLAERLEQGVGLDPGNPFIKRKWHLFILSGWRRRRAEQQALSAADRRRRAGIARCRTSCRCASRPGAQARGSGRAAIADDRCRARPVLRLQANLALELKALSGG